MYKLNLITIVSIVAAVSFVVGMTAPAIAFAAQHASMNTTDNMGLMGNMTGGNATPMTGGNLTMSEMSNATSLTGQ